MARPALRLMRTDISLRQTEPSECPSGTSGPRTVSHEIKAKDIVSSPKEASQNVEEDQFVQSVGWKL